MKRYIGILVLAALLWGGYWAVKAYALRSGVEEWFEARRADGWTAEYSALSVRGFPSRLDVTLEGITLADPEAGTGWEAPFLQILGLTYQPGHVILAFPERQVLTLPEGAQVITSQGLRASLVRDGQRISRLNGEADVLNISRDGRDVALAGVLANFHHDGAATGDADAPRYQLAVRAQAVATPSNAVAEGRSDGLDLRATLGFDELWTLDALAGPRPQPRAIDLTRAQYRLEGLELDVAGQLDVDREGRADGALTVRAVNWRDLLDQARASGALPAGLADTLRNGLSLAAGLNGRADTLDLPLRFSRGEVSLGIIPLGRAPRIVLP